MIFSGIIGFNSAALGAIHPRILERIVGRSNFAVAYGFAYMFSAAGVFIGPPIAGI